jgi:hypothetical protein
MSTEKAKEIYSKLGQINNTEDDEIKIIEQGLTEFASQSSPAPSRWISVTESLPEKAQSEWNFTNDCKVRTKDGDEYIAYYHWADKIWYTEENNRKHSRYRILHNVIEWQFINTPSSVSPASLTDDYEKLRKVVSSVVSDYLEIMTVGDFQNLDISQKIDALTMRLRDRLTS